MTGFRSPDSEMTPAGRRGGSLEIEPAFFQDIQIGETVRIEEAGFVVEITGLTGDVSGVGSAPGLFVILAWSVPRGDFHGYTVVTAELVQSCKQTLEVTLEFPR